MRQFSYLHTISVVLHVNDDVSIELNIAILMPNDVIVPAQTQVVFYIKDHVAKGLAIVTKHLCRVIRILRRRRVVQRFILGRRRSALRVLPC